MKLHLTIQVMLMAIVLSLVNSKGIKKSREIRSTWEERDPDNLNTPAPTSAPTEEPQHFRDCDEIQDRSTIRPISGVYKIKPIGVEEPFEVSCDFDVDGGGWTVIQRRVDGSVNFELQWKDYKEGFGNPETAFWLGNDKIHSMTKEKRYQLRIELTNAYGLQYYAKYSYFTIDDEGGYYKLSIGSYSGNAVDGLTYHNGMYFSTEDEDHDQYDGNCAAGYYGGWWYNSCRHSQLNGRYSDYIYWTLPGPNNYIQFTEMKIRAV